jgi:hypothetical protein
MSGYVTHRDDIALLMVRQKPAVASAGWPDSGQLKEVW